MSFEALLDQLNAALEGIPPGPERERRTDEIARRCLDESVTDRERLFWRSFLSAGEPERKP